MTKEEKNMDSESLKDMEAVTDDRGLDEQIADENDIMNTSNPADEFSVLKKQLQEKDNELRAYTELAQRVKAEFDNYKKRIAKEREQQYTDITGDIIFKFLPIIDNLERAISVNSDDSSIIADGIEMILKQFKEILSKEGVEEIEALGQQFNPYYHEAVMHIEDEEYESNAITEVFRKGYKIKDKILRHSMVKVAN